MATKLPQRPADCPRETSVFLNVPYDAAYRPVFDALILTTLAYGAWPRWAADSGGDPRFERIVGGLRGSRLSVHDLSRCRGAGDDLNLARMNMPLELGMAVEMAWPSRERDHRWIVLVPEDGIYRRAVSDLDGFDLLPYDGRPEAALVKLSSALKIALERQQPDVRDVRAALPLWQEALEAQRQANAGEELTWAEWLRCWQRVAAAAGLRAPL